MILFSFSGPENQFRPSRNGKRDLALLASVSLIALCFSLPAAAQSATASAPILLGTLGGIQNNIAGMSSDGSTLVGESTLAGEVTTHAYRWTSALGLTDIGTLGGSYSIASAVSADGSVVVGDADTSGDALYHAFRWTSAGMTDLGSLGGSYSWATAVNSDGSVVVGQSTYTNASSATHAFRWTSASGMADLGTLGGTTSTAMAVSSDGSVVAGQSTLSGESQEHSFRWTSTAGMTDLGTLGGSFSWMHAISSDGSTVVGESTLSGDSQQHAYRWTSATGMTDLGTLGGIVSLASLVSADGSVVAGQSLMTGNNAEHAFRWTGALGMTDLGTLGGAYSSPQAMSSDGSIIVGQSTLTGTSTVARGSHAFRWTSATGMADLNTLLSNAGVNMTGITLASATMISTNGQVIAGETSANSPYIVRYVDAVVSTPPAGPAADPPAAPVGGMTTTASVQDSANQLSRQRQTIMGQEHGFVDQMLQEGTRMASPNAAGVYGALGSATGGGSGRTQYGPLELIMGLGVASENYAGASMNDAFMAAAKLRYLHMFNAQYGLFGEIGGFYSPSGTYNFSRTYANGAGVAKATQQVSGEQGYGFGRLGALINVTPADEFSPSLEIGRQSLQTGSYSELFSALNPFEAYLASSYSALDVFKARAQWTHSFTSAIDATIWAAWAHGFNYYDGSQLIVDSIGTFTPHYSSTLNWAEYGVRVGYQVNEMITASLFVNGVAGDITGAKAHIGGGVSARF